MQSCKWNLNISHAHPIMAIILLSNPCWAIFLSVEFPHSMSDLCNISQIIMIRLLETRSVATK